MHVREKNKDKGGDSAANLCKYHRIRYSRVETYQRKEGQGSDPPLRFLPGTGNIGFDPPSEVRAHPLMGGGISC